MLSIPFDQGKTVTRLTEKQTKFAESLAAGETQSDAYRMARAISSTCDETIWSEASRLAKHPKVSSRVDQLKAERDALRQSLVLDKEEAILARL